VSYSILQAAVHNLGAHCEGSEPLFAMHATLRAVVELHKPTTFLRRPLATPICDTCSADDDAHDVPSPCSTIQAIARELGVDSA
jgi:hypothetical protein